MTIARFSVLLLVLVAGGCFGGAVGPRLPTVAAQEQDLRDKGHHALLSGDVARAGQFFDEERRLAESFDDRAGLAGALNDLGLVAGLLGNPGKAEEFHRRAHEIGAGPVVELAVRDAHHLGRAGAAPTFSCHFVHEASPRRDDTAGTTAVQVARQE